MTDCAAIETFSYFDVFTVVIQNNVTCTQTEVLLIGVDYAKIIW